MNELWTLEEIVEAVDGHVHFGPSAPERNCSNSSVSIGALSISSVSIDSRTLDPCALYVAIKGVQQDGHLYVGAAFKAGASVCLVSGDYDAAESDGILVQVPDTLKALEQLAIAARKRSTAKIIAVTGSAGKTGTKEALREMFELFGKTHASIKSFNNHWGVPLSLARMPRDCEFGIFEVGMNHAGEISPLSKLIQPDIALITTVAPAHIGYFANEEEIADAKAEIFDGLVPGGAVVLPADNRHFERLKLAAVKAGVKHVFGFGRPDFSEFHLLSGEYGSEGCSVLAELLGDRVDFRLSIPGEHIALNFLGALGCVMLAGCDVLKATSALSTLMAPAGRGVRHSLVLPAENGGGDFLLIDESYNASPPSMEIALKNLSAMKEDTYCRRIAVLGDMLELGDHSEHYHREISPLVANLDVDLVFAAGEMMAHMFNDLPSGKKGAYSKVSAELIAPLEECLQSGDAVMIKGSLGSDMGRVVSALCAKYE